MIASGRSASSGRRGGRHPLAACAFALAAAGLAGAAAAQEQPDPIDALLSRPPPAAATAQGTVPTAPDASTDEPEEGRAAPATPPYTPFPSRAVTPPPAAVSTLRPYSPFPSPAASAVRPSTDGVPVNIEEAGRTPDRPPTSTDLGYEARLRASFASAQGLQGPLDGRWTLSADGGGDLYVLQLVDKGLGPLEGAWRDVRRAGAIEGSGFLADIQRFGGGLNFRFYPRAGGGVSAANLTMGADGRWTGELDDGGERRPVTMRRN